MTFECQKQRLLIHRLSYYLWNNLRAFGCAVGWFGTSHSSEIWRLANVFSLDVNLLLSIITPAVFSGSGLQGSWHWEPWPSCLYLIFYPFCTIIKGHNYYTGWPAAVCVPVAQRLYQSKHSRLFVSNRHKSNHNAPQPFSFNLDMPYSVRSSSVLYCIDLNTH